MICARPTLAKTKQLQDSLLNTSMRHSTPELSFGTAQCGFSGSGGFVGVSDSASRIPDSYGEVQLRPKPAVRHARQPYMAPCFSWTTTRQALPVRCVCLFLGWDCPAPMSTNQIKHEDSIYWSLKHLLSQHLTTFYKSFIGNHWTKHSISHLNLVIPGLLLTAFGATIAAFGVGIAQHDGVFCSAFGILLGKEPPSFRTPRRKKRHCWAPGDL